MTPSTLAALKSLAEGATPGPRRTGRLTSWTGDGTPLRRVYTKRKDTEFQCLGPNCDADGEFLVAASPDVVLALVAEVERMREALEDEYAGWAYSPEHEEVRVCIGCTRQDARSAQRAATWEQIQHLPGCALRSEP